MSRNELRVCMDTSLGMDGRYEAYEAASNELEVESRWLSDEAHALSRVLRTLDNNDRFAVDKYNDRNTERNRRVSRYNQKSDAMQAVQARLKSDRADYLAKCVARTFLMADEEALLKEDKRRKSLSNGDDAGEARPRPAPGKHDT